MRLAPCLALLTTLALPAAERRLPVSLHEIALKTLDGKSQSLSTYQGKVV